LPLDPDALVSLLDQALKQEQETQDAHAADQIPTQDGNEQVLSGGCRNVEFQGFHRKLLSKRGGVGLFDFVDL
jgi:hypothetical protein